LIIRISFVSFPILNEPSIDFKRPQRGGLLWARQTLAALPHVWKEDQ
jgi:hypothetical protein